MRNRHQECVVVSCHELGTQKIRSVVCSDSDGTAEARGTGTVCTQHTQEAQRNGYQLR